MLYQHILNIYLHTRENGSLTVYNLYIIRHNQTGYKYLGYDKKPVNKIWREILENHDKWNGALWNTMKSVGVDQFKLNIVEEVMDNKIEERFEYWLSKGGFVYNEDVVPYVGKTINNKDSYKKGKRKWGYNRKHKPKAKRTTNIIKCRSLETGKLKTLHGWQACVDFCGGDMANIKRAVRTGGSAYGYKWWIYKRNSDVKRSVYGIGKENNYTKTFDSISEAMRAFGVEDKGKGICTSIKWGTRWKGYLWYYSD